MVTKKIIENAFPYPSEYIGTGEDGVTPMYDRAIGSAPYREIWKTFFSDGIGDEQNDFALTLEGGFGLALSGGRYFADGVTGVVNRETGLQAEAPPTSGERTDRIVIQNNYADRYTYILIKKGETGLVRNDETYEIGLYDIRVRANAAEIQAGDVTDLRSNRSVCGKILTSDAAGLIGEIEGLGAYMQNLSADTEKLKVATQPATAFANGLMSAGDKAKLDGVAEGAAAIVTGVYTGDGKAGRIIPLGFTPKAVLAMSSKGGAYYSDYSSTIRTYYYGGLALPGYNVSRSAAGIASWSEADSVLGIAPGGFKVNYGSLANDMHIYSNSSGETYMYMAIK